MTAIQTPKSLTEAQIRLLRLFSVMSSNESDEIIGLVQTHLQQKLDQELDRVITEKNYSQKDYDAWLLESNRTEMRRNRSALSSDFIVKPFGRSQV